MNRRSIISISTITVLGLALVPSAAVSQQKSLKEQVVGIWTLVSADTTASNGTKRQFDGANPRGILILDASGRYAVVQGRPDRPKIKSASRFQYTTEEVGAAAREFAANFGTWSVNEADKTLTRRFEGALIPNNEGSDFKYSISLAGDELKLTGVSSVTGDRTDTVYRRAK
jgi:hypothetical protein